MEECKQHGASTDHALENRAWIIVRNGLFQFGIYRNGVLYSNPYITLRTLLVQARNTCGLRQEELALLLGKSQSFVSKVERGERYLDTIDFIVWCKALSIEPSAAIAEISVSMGAERR